MDLENIKPYWPYILGGVIGLVLIMKFASRSSSGGSIESQNQGAALAYQSSVDFEKLRLVAEAQARSDKLESDKLFAQSQIGYLEAQSKMALSVGAASAEVATALFQPSLSAINAAAYENATAIQYASAIAASSYASQADIVKSTAQSGAMINESLSSMWGDVALGTLGAITNVSGIKGRESVTRIYN